MKIKNIPDISYLILSLVFFTMVWWFWPQEIIASDQWAYSKFAYEMASEGTINSDHIFAQRLAITAPTALFYALFGISPKSTNLLPLISVYIIICTIWFSLPNLNSRLIGLVLSLTSGLLILAGTHLLPDIVATAFMSLSFLLFTKRYLCIQRGNCYQKLIPLFFILSLFISFLAKLSAYWIVIPLLIISLKDYGDNKFRNLFKTFYAPSLLIALVFLCTYFFICFIIWDDPLSRITAIREVSGKHLWNMDAQKLILRLSVSPVIFFMREFGMLILMIPIFIKIKSPWKIYLFSCLFLFWFGTVSLSSYQPMPLMSRMAFPLLPAIIILSSLFISDVINKRKSYKFLGLVLVISINGPQLLYQSYAAAKNDLGELNSINTLNYFVNKKPSESIVLITSEPRSPESLLMHYNYKYPTNLKVLSMDSFLNKPIESARYFYFEHSSRLEFLSRAYGTKVYKLSSIIDEKNILYKSQKITLFKLPPIEVERILNNYKQKDAQ